METLSQAGFDVVVAEVDRGLCRLPDYMRDGMRRYIVQGIPPGDFMSAVLKNDLMEAFGRADDTNQRFMHNYAMFLYNDAPRGCYGSPNAFYEWCKEGGLQGMLEPVS